MQNYTIIFTESLCVEHYNRHRKECHWSTFGFCFCAPEQSRKETPANEETMCPILWAFEQISGGCSE